MVFLRIYNANSINELCRDHLSEGSSPLANGSPLINNNCSSNEQLSSSADLARSFPTFQHPSHELLKDNGFIQQKYSKYHIKALKGLQDSSNLITLKILIIDDAYFINSISLSISLFQNANDRESDNHKR